MTENLQIVTFSNQRYWNGWDCFVNGFTSLSKDTVR